MFSFTLTGRDLIFLHAVITLWCVQAAAQNKEYWCTRKNLNPGPDMPKLPESYTMRAEVTYKTKTYVTDILGSVDIKRGRESIEMWSGKKHVRFITLEEEDAFISIAYTQNGPSCSTAKLSKINKREVFAEKNAGPLSILQVVSEEAFTGSSKFVTADNGIIRGMGVTTWEMCDYLSGLDKVVRITLYFTDGTWTLAHQNTSQPIQALVRMQIEGYTEGNKDLGISLVVDIYSYQSNITSDEYFQVPQDVHCPDFSRNKTLPTMPNHFSYQSEKLIEQSKNSFVILHSKVFYDYTSKIIRVDSQDTQNKDSSSELTQSLTTIMDFNTGVKYTINTALGSCQMDELKETMNFLTTLMDTQDMLDPQKFFAMDGVAYSYIGEYETRGMATDIFSGAVDTKGKKKVIHFWYFTPDRTKVIKEEVEKHVLVKVVSRPESLLARKNRTEINFYNFNKERPSVFDFDISVCYNESESKTYVVTFPGKYNALLEKNAYVLQHRVHDELWKKAGVSPQRISMQKITFGDNYFFVQFKILRRPTLGQATEAVKKENDLSKAESEIRTAIANQKLIISLETNQDPPVIRLKAEPDSFKEFKEDKEKEITFNERSVAGLSIGMTVLGFLLGGVVVNLIFTRKYGVSLLQKSTFGGDAQAFDNPLNESSM